MDRTNKKAKWTIMKYVNDFNLIIEYANTIRDLKAKVDENSIIELNKIMEDLRIYVPRYGKPSVDTTNFKICQLIYFMIAYRSMTTQKELIFSPLGNLLLDHSNDENMKSKIFATMLYNMPFNHPYNKMSSDFNIYPYRLLFKLLCDERLDYKLYLDDVFYYVIWSKTINDKSYEKMINDILEFRKISPEDKLNMFKERLSLEDALANALHETTYLFGQLASAGIASITEGNKIGILYHGGFGRKDVPDFLPQNELAKIKRTGVRSYTTNCIKLKSNVSSLIRKLLNNYSYDEKPHDLLNILGRQDYILHLYNFYPKELLQELGISQNRIQTMLQISKNINKYSRNKEEGDCYRFEKILADAFNEFDDVDAKTIGGAGNTDVECIYLTIDEKFAIEAKSTHTKLGSINAGRLQLHRSKINAKYTIIVAPYYKPSVEADIKGTKNVMITASTLSNFLYQATIHSLENVSYAPLYNIVQDSLGTNITSKVNEYVAKVFGIGKAQID